ncbi:unnamed protein product [Chondrus crispus]|uniref:Uncharacterized protein n=1 Tax=Chondrus crispus TaxID=2769 RepID=R7Q709_CHOCR|nr:unnamed protein product [Chondrus crispus]CDF33255.1 unnamed protein product [Chondrus crispus]|eukprot:XP_005713058.1 unnamed protein product [Chondrus crispus]
MQNFCICIAEILVCVSSVIEHRGANRSSVSLVSFPYHTSTIATSTVSQFDLINCTDLGIRLALPKKLPQKSSQID